MNINEVVKELNENHSNEFLAKFGWIIIDPRLRFRYSLNKNEIIVKRDIREFEFYDLADFIKNAGFDQPDKYCIDRYGARRAYARIAGDVLFICNPGYWESIFKANNNTFVVGINDQNKTTNIVFKSSDKVLKNWDRLDDLFEEHSNQIFQVITNIFEQWNGFEFLK